MEALPRGRGHHKTGNGIGCHSDGETRTHHHLHVGARRGTGDNGRLRRQALSYPLQQGRMPAAVCRKQGHNGWYRPRHAENGIDDPGENDEDRDRARDLFFQRNRRLRGGVHGGVLR